MRLYIKLTLIAPAKKSVICNLKFSDFSEDYRMVIVNKTSIRIPNGLRNNILDAINLSKEICNNKPKEDASAHIVGICGYSAGLLHHIARYDIIFPPY